MEWENAFYRNLDPQIGRFLQIDPIAHFSEGPYVSMGNNPVSATDYLGDYFTFGSKGLENAYKNLKKENANKILGYLSQLSKMDLNSKDKSTQKQINQLQALVNAHTEFGSQLTQMENSAVEFHYSNEKPVQSASANGETGYSFSDQRINLAMGTDNPSMTTMAHETRHGYGYLVGEMSASKYGDGLYDMMDEVVAYKTGALFGSESDIYNVAIGDWGIEDFKKAPYPWLIGKEESLTINTPAAIFANYSQDGPLNSLIKNTNNANLTTGQAMQMINAATQKAKGESRYLWGEQLKKK